MSNCATNKAQRGFCLAAAVCLAGSLLSSGPAAAQTVWSGLTFSFTRPDFVTGTDPAHQDTLTPNVTFARLVQRGLFNSASELGYVDNVSPVNTAWASDLIEGNETETIAATNWANLTFTNWVDAFGGLRTGQLPNLLTSRNAVVHLIEDDIYLDIAFSSWGFSGDANFSYMRSEPPLPSPTGDYNGNGVVDAADYTVWRDTLGENVSSGRGADGDADGMIGIGDYNFWKTRFGSTVPGTGSAGASHSQVAVPEPSTLVLLTLATLLLRRRGARP